MMRVYKVLEIDFYNRLMDIYRQHYSKVENNTSEVSVSKVSEEPEEDRLQLGGDKPFWSTFEQTVEQVRQQQKEQKKKRKRV